MHQGGDNANYVNGVIPWKCFPSIMTILAWLGLSQDAFLHGGSRSDWDQCWCPHSSLTVRHKTTVLKPGDTERPAGRADPGQDHSQAVTGAVIVRCKTRFVVITCHSYICDLLALLLDLLSSIVTGEGSWRVTMSFPAHISTSIQLLVTKYLTIYINPSFSQYQIPSIEDLWWVKLRIDANMSNHRDNLNILED